MNVDSTTTADSANQNQQPNASASQDAAAIQAAELQATLKKLQADLAKVNAEKADLAKKAADLERAKAEGAGDFKSLWEVERKQREELEAKLQDTTAAFIQTQKHAAAKDALVKAGLNPDAMRILDKESFDELQVEIQDKRMQVLGTETLVEKWRKEYGFLFKNERPTPTVNTGGTGNGANFSGGEITAQKLYEIERKHGSRSKEYTDATLAYFNQKKQKTAAR